MRRTKTAKVRAALMSRLNLNHVAASLMWASQRLHGGCVQLLLRAAADPELKQALCSLPLSR